MPPDSSLNLWLRRNLAWSADRQAWEERLGVLALAAGAALALWFGASLVPSQKVLVWGLLLVGLAVVLRRGWLRLFGPVLFYDLVRTGRGTRWVWIRTGYGLLLLFIFLSIFPGAQDQSQGGTSDPIRRMADCAWAFFSTFFLIQFLAIGLLAPAYTAGAIAEEKERRTLEFVLATDLSNREIILSKQASRLAKLVLFVLIGLPVLSLTQLLGGVDPDLVLAGFAATGMTLLSLTALSVLCSVYHSKTRNAIVQTYMVVIVYFVISAIMAWIFAVNPWLPSIRLTWGEDPITVHDLTVWYNTGNLIAALYTLANSLGPSSISQVLPTLLAEYAAFHGLATLVFTTWAVARLRKVALKEASVPALTPSEGLLRSRRPPVGSRPVLWKEIHTDPVQRMNWIGRILFGVLLVASLFPAAWIVGYNYLYRPTSWGESPWLEVTMNIYVRVVGTIVTCLSLLAVAVRASQSVSTERDRQTWESLLTSPLESAAILSGKWIGSFLSVRLLWIWLAVVWGTGVATGGMSVLALPGLVVAWVIYAALFTSLGLLFSTICKSTLRATLATMGVLFLVTVGHWPLRFLLCLPFMFSGMGAQPMEWMAKFQAYGLTPPATLALLQFHGAELKEMEAEAMAGWMVLGLVCWAVAAGFLWGFLSVRFREATRRNPFPRVIAADSSSP